MDKRYAVKIAKKFSNEIKGFFPIEKVVLFGSFAKGTNHEWSDIDIAVVVKKFNFDFFEAYSKMGDVRFRLDLRIEPIIIDKNKDYSGFLKTIYKEGIVVYSA
ncbi:MAG: nucleotidyltransferase domain-containing protein [Ignavibacteriae bacterium]|nr:MAG: nucleotidyltransferase domain-containing protein [Ignavibacteriota bacterium]